MKSTDKDLFACERQVITEAEMQEIDESLAIDKPIETKALADAKRNAFYAKLWVTLNSLFLLIIIYAVIHFLRGQA